MYRNIREAFIYQARNIIENGYIQNTHSKKRIQLSTVNFFIKNPLETFFIEGVPARDVPVICSEDQAIFYFKEIMNSSKGSYDYTYGNRIHNQIDTVVSKLKNYTNNAQIVIASPDDHLLKNRPCLQLLDFKRLPEGKLDMHMYFRSWDIFALPYNLIGFSYFFEYICLITELKMNYLYCYSSGLNCRGEMMNLLNKVATYLQP